MNPTPEEAVFEQALLRPEELRAVFLDGACLGDAGMRKRVEALLAAHVCQSRPHEGGDTTEASVSIDVAASLTEGVGTAIGRYKLLEKLGEGGFGAVWAAEQREPVRRRVALKIIKLGMDTRQVVARFEAERQALALMDHPNIAKVLDAGATVTGRPYFVMELVKGIPITKYCEQERLDTKSRLALFIHVCHAIQHAHQKGIIHRDIKPSNILVTLHDGVPVPKVIDFGIAKATQAELTEKTIYTQFHQFIGTPAYMSPEQAEMSGLDIDTRSDIYSLGVLLYELLTGATPFDTTELMQSGLDAMRKIIREREPEKPSTRLYRSHASPRSSPSSTPRSSPIPSDLDWIVMKCLEKDRTRRFDTANGLAIDIQRHLTNEPILARPPSKAYRFQKALRRNKLAFTAAGAVLGALVLGLGLATWAFIRENQAYQRTLQAEQEQSRLHRKALAAQRQAAEQRDLAQERLYQSLLREARSIRKARQIGYRSEVFDRLRQAMALPASRIDPSPLRREATASLGDWVGLQPVDIFLSASVLSARLTPDGFLAALATSDGTVSLWGAATGKQVASFEVGGIPIQLGFEPSGRTLFVAVVQGPRRHDTRPESVSIQQWSLREDGTWKQDSAWTEEGLTWIVPSADGPVALVVDNSNTFWRVFDLVRHVELSRVRIGGPMPALPQATISRDRRQLAFFSLAAASDFDVQLEFWDLEAGKQITVLQPKLGPGYGLAFGPDGNFLVATYDNTLIVYDTDRFHRWINLGGSYENTAGGAIGGSADLLAVPSIQEIAVRLIRLRNGVEVAYLKLPGPAISLDFSEDGLVLLLTYPMGSRIVHLDVARERIRLEGHQGGVPAATFSPNAKHLASVGKDRTLRLWDLEKPGHHQILAELPAPGQTLDYTDDGKFLVCGHYNTSALTVWSAESGRKVAHIVEPTAGHGTTWSSAMSPNGTYFASIGSVLRVWKTADLVQPAARSEVVRPPWFSATNGVASVAFDFAERNIAYMDNANPNGSSFSPILMIRGLDPNAAPRLIAKDIQNNFIQAIGFLPRRDEVVYVTRQREIKVLDTASGKTLHSFATLDPGDTSPWFSANLRPSPDGSMLAILTLSGLGVEVRDTQTGQLLYSLPEEAGSIWWLTWSPDNQRLAVTRANGVIDIWNLEEIEDQLAKLQLNPMP